MEGKSLKMENWLSSGIKRASVTIITRFAHDNDTDEHMAFREIWCRAK